MNKDRMIVINNIKQSVFLLKKSQVLAPEGRKVI